MTISARSGREMEPLSRLLRGTLAVLADLREGDRTDGEMIRPQARPP